MKMLICQVTAQKNQWELDKLVTFTRVTKMMTPDEVDAPSRDGAYITGLSLQGAKWDVNGNSLCSSEPKVQFCPMPIIHVKVRRMMRVVFCSSLLICANFFLL